MSENKPLRRFAGVAPLAAAVPLATLAGCRAATPCTAIDRGLTAIQKISYGRAVASDLHVPAVEVLQSFQLGEWRVLYAETGNSDESFFFFAGDPAAKPFVTRWSGGAARSEQAAIEAWTLAHATGIPAPLAACFAWHVTNDRDQ